MQKHSTRQKAGGQQPPRRALVRVSRVKVQQLPRRALVRVKG